MTARKKRQGIWIYWELWIPLKYKGLVSDSQRLVAAELLTLALEQGSDVTEAETSERLLARRTGLSKTAVGKALKSLEELGLLEVAARGTNGQVKSSFRLVWREWADLYLAMVSPEDWHWRMRVYAEDSGHFLTSTGHSEVTGEDLDPEDRSPSTGHSGVTGTGHSEVTGSGHWGDQWDRVVEESTGHSGVTGSGHSEVTGSGHSGVTGPCSREVEKRDQVPSPTPPERPDEEVEVQVFPRVWTALADSTLYTGQAPSDVAQTLRHWINRATLEGFQTDDLTRAARAAGEEVAEEQRRQAISGGRRIYSPLRLAVRRLDEKLRSRSVQTGPRDVLFC